jgi:hypothetical protein
MGCCVSLHKHAVLTSTLFRFYDEDDCSLERGDLIDKKGKKFLLTIKA